VNADVHSLAGPYVLDALLPPERDMFERHLAGCATCQAEVRELGATAIKLGAAAAGAPPPQLKSAVMTRIATTRQYPPSTTVRRGQRPARGERADRSSRGWRAATWRRPLLAAAAALVLVASAGAGVAVVEMQRAQREAENIAQQQAEILDVLLAPDGRLVQTQVRGGGRATVAVSAEEDRGVILLDRLPATASDESYQLWVIKGQQAASAGVVDVEQPGRQSRRLPSGVSSADAIGITVEPRGGSEAPTTKPIAQLPLG
jgi:anti-sigma-K factor RskA/putative zinc finger protein